MLRGGRWYACWTINAVVILALRSARYTKRVSYEIGRQSLMARGISPTADPSPRSTCRRFPVLAPFIRHSPIVQANWMPRLPVRLTA